MSYSRENIGRNGGAVRESSAWNGPGTELQGRVCHFREDNLQILSHKIVSSVIFNS